MSDMDDALDAVEAEAREERAALRAQRASDPVRKLKKNRGRAQRNRGRRAEYLVADFLSGHGFRRVPMSGALGGRLSGDVARLNEDFTIRGVRGNNPVILALEVKKRNSCDRVLRAQLAQGKADALVRVPGGTLEPLVVLTLTKFRYLLSEAGYGLEDGQ